MWRVSRNFLTLSLIVSAVVTLVLWAALWQMVIRPVRRLTSNIIAFGERPAGQRRRIVAPSGARRRDRPRRNRARGDAESRSRTSSASASGSPNSGMAVARINHDLRNMLAAAQLISDRLATIPDPLAQRLAPRLVATLDRAIDFCQSTLTYGAAREQAPTRRRFDLRELVRADRRDGGSGQRRRDRLRDRHSAEFRTLRRSAIMCGASSRISAATRRRRWQTIGARGGRPAAIRFAAIRTAGVALIEVSDTGPGFPPEQPRAHLRAVPLSTREGGSGLGLAIAGRSRRAQRRLDRAWRRVQARRFLLRRALSHHPADAEERDASRARARSGA